MATIIRTKAAAVMTARKGSVLSSSAARTLRTA